WPGAAADRRECAGRSTPARPATRPASPRRETAAPPAPRTTGDATRPSPRRPNAPSRGVRDRIDLGIAGLLEVTDDRQVRDHADPAGASVSEVPVHAVALAVIEGDGADA